MDNSPSKTGYFETAFDNQGRVGGISNPIEGNEAGRKRVGVRVGRRVHAEEVAPVVLRVGLVAEDGAPEVLGQARDQGLLHLGGEAAVGDLEGGLGK